jgi:hypothetical protein
MFTQQELEAAYEQMKHERLADHAWAIRAAAKLKELSGVAFSERYEGYGQWGVGHVPPISPFHINYELFTSRCQYDDWDGLEKLLEPHCTIQRDQRMTYPHRSYLIRATFDVSGFPELKGHQKVYNVVVEYYDSHVGGW